MRNVSTLIIVLLALSAAGSVQAAEESDHAQATPHGKAWVQKKVKACASCHGDKGVSQTPNFPVIAGQYKSYLLHTLKTYRDGDREDAVMAGQVKGMSDAQLEALAAYYARQESPLHTPTLSK